MLEPKLPLSLKAVHNNDVYFVHDALGEFVCSCNTWRVAEYIILTCNAGPEEVEELEAKLVDLEEQLNDCRAVLDQREKELESLREVKRQILAVAPTLTNEPSPDQPN